MEIEDGSHTMKVSMSDDFLLHLLNGEEANKKTIAFSNLLARPRIPYGTHRLLFSLYAADLPPGTFPTAAKIRELWRHPESRRVVATAFKRAQTYIAEHYGFMEVQVERKGDRPVVHQMLSDVVTERQMQELRSRASLGQHT